MTLDEIFRKIGNRLQQDAGRFREITGTFYFALSGDDGGDYFIRLDNGQAQWGEGIPDQADCTVTMTASDFKNLVSGRLNPMTALATGKLRLEGDMSLALRLQSLLG